MENREWIVQRCTQQMVDTQLQYQDWGPHGPGTMTPMTKSELLNMLAICQRRWPREEFRGHNVVNCKCTEHVRYKSGEKSSMHPGELCICGHTYEVHFGHDCSEVNCRCKRFVLIDDGLEMVEALLRLFETGQVCVSLVELNPVKGAGRFIAAHQNAGRVLRGGGVLG